MELYGSILGALGAIASIVSLAAAWRAHPSWLLRFSFFLIFALTTSSAYFSYQYYQVTKPEMVRAAKQAELTAAAKKFISNNQMTTSYWVPGENEGIIKSGLILLELYKELYPDAYVRIKSDIDADLDYAQKHRDEQEQRQSMETAAKSIIKTIKTLAGNG